MSKRRLVVLLSDTHGGHKLGLLSPETVIYDEDESGNLRPYTPDLMAMQRYLWELYTGHIKSVRELAGRDEIIVVHNGDVTQGLKYPEHLVSTRLSDQVLIGFCNLKPWLELRNVRTVRVVKGTASHVLGEGSSEILIARMLAQAYPNKDVQALYHGLLDVGGVTFDCAHHGPFPGSRNWLKGNVARYYLRSLMLDDVLHGRDPPRVVARAHYHVYVRETLRLEVEGQEHASDLIITPSYCGVGDHGRRVTRSTSLQTHGLVACEVVGGELRDVHPFKETLDLRTYEQV